VAPLAIAWPRWCATSRRAARDRGRCCGACWVSLVGALLVFLANEPWTAELANWRALARFCFWIASRLRPAFTAIATFISVRSRSSGRQFSHASFSGIAPIDRRTCAEGPGTHLAITLGALVIAALFSERRLHESAILEREGPLTGRVESAELADRAKSSFLAAASHDLRQPLQTL